MRSMITSALNLIPPWVLAGMPSVCKPLPEGIGCLTAQWTGGSVKDRDRGIWQRTLKSAGTPPRPGTVYQKRGDFRRPNGVDFRGTEHLCQLTTVFCMELSPI